MEPVSGLRSSDLEAMFPIFTPHPWNSGLVNPEFNAEGLITMCPRIKPRDEIDVV